MSRLRIFIHYLCLLCICYSYRNETDFNRRLRANDFHELLGSESLGKFQISREWMELKSQLKYDMRNNRYKNLFVCNSDRSKSGGERRNSLLSSCGMNERSVTTIYNTAAKSCYIVYAEGKESLKISEMFSILPLRENMKIRSQTFKRVTNPERKGAIIIKTLMFKKRIPHFNNATAEIELIKEMLLQNSKKETYKKMLVEGCFFCFH